MKKQMTMMMLGAGLLVAQALVPGATPDAQAGPDRCAEAVKKIAYDYKNHKNWSAANIKKLCGGVTHTQPAICFDKVVHGRLAYGHGNQWRWQNAVELCKAAPNANTRISCFKEQEADWGWSKAIKICNGSLPKPKKSTAKRALGQHCADGAQCQTGECDTRARQCVPRAQTGATGGFCTMNHHCQTGQCKGKRCQAGKLWAKCNKNTDCTSGRCVDTRRSPGKRCIVKPGTGMRTQACMADNDCRGNLWCGIYVCEAQRPLSHRCSGDEQCVSGRCDVTPNVNKCIPKAGSGQSSDFCTRDRQCRSDLRCLNNHCGKPRLKRDGDPCKHFSECVSKTCDAGPGTGNSNRCVPKRGTGGRGAFCTSNIYCRSANCDLRAKKCK